MAKALTHAPRFVALCAWVALASVTFTSAGASAQARSSGAAPGTGPSTTQAGVYTAKQAQLGEDTYYTLCISCHPKGTYAGPGFKSNWNGKPLSELYDWVLNKMPKNDPGSLTPAESVQVIAYILQQNKLPAGNVALPANEKTLDGIKIQIK